MQVGLLLPPQDRTKHRYMCVADAAHPKAMEYASVLKLASVAYMKFNGNINRVVQQGLLQLDQLVKWARSRLRGPPEVQLQAPFRAPSAPLQHRCFLVVQNYETTCSCKLEAQVLA